MIHAIKKSFTRTLPVMAGYIFLGIAFGILADSHGFSPLTALAMSIFVYAAAPSF